LLSESAGVEGQVGGGQNLGGVVGGNNGWLCAIEVRHGFCMYVVICRHARISSKYFVCYYYLLSE
jgi:hypothetical protein